MSNADLHLKGAVIYTPENSHCFPSSSPSPHHHHHRHLSSPLPSMPQPSHPKAGESGAVRCCAVLCGAPCPPPLAPGTRPEEPAPMSSGPSHCPAPWMAPRREKLEVPGEQRSPRPWVNAAGCTGAGRCYGAGVETSGLASVPRARGAVRCRLKPSSWSCRLRPPGHPHAAPGIYHCPFADASFFLLLLNSQHQLELFSLLTVGWFVCVPALERRGGLTERDSGEQAHALRRKRLGLFFLKQ